MFPRLLTQLMVVRHAHHRGTFSSRLAELEARVVMSATTDIRTRFAPAQVRLRLGQPPDDDFAFMARAARFVPAGGGFSRLVAALVRRFGGAVLEPPPCDGNATQKRR